MTNGIPGCTRPETWDVWHGLLGKEYFAERRIEGRLEMREVTAHCLACAKVEILTRYGGKVDLRGWHMAKGSCGAHLLVIQRAIEQGEDEEVAT
jgi:hypothetical protein